MRRDQVYYYNQPKENWEAYRVYYEPDNISSKIKFGIQLYNTDRSDWRSLMDQSKYSRIFGLEEPGFPSHSWLIPTTRFIIDMDVWNKFILNAFSSGKLPLKELQDFLKKYFNWTPDPKFKDIKL